MTEIVVAISPSSYGEADDAPLALLRELGITIRENPFRRRLTEEEAAEHLNGVDGLIAGLEPLTRKVMSANAERLKAIARVGIGTDNVDFDAATEFGVKVSNTPGPPADAVAELTVAAALSLLRGLDSSNRAMHDGCWRKQISLGLRGTPVLLVGFGRIGRATARLFDSFGAELMATDPEFSPEAGLEVESVSLHEGLQRARIISLHAAGRAEIIGDNELRLLQPGTILLNGARGELVSQESLRAALDQGTLGGAWFDVFWEEPYSGFLTEYDHVLLTPHIGTYTRSCRREMEMQAALNLVSDLGMNLPEQGGD